MKKERPLSKQTRNNWLIDGTLFLGALVSSLSGIYFLYLPVGGYQGGRNPMYGVVILFKRETWDDLHTWFGIMMILAAVFHIVIHWRWIVGMTKRVFQELTQGDRRLNTRSHFNVSLNMLIGLSFVATAISGIYLLLFPGGSRGVIDPMILFSRTTWDLIHTWAGIIMIDAWILHFIIHWGWIVKVTGKLFGSSLPFSLQKLAINPVKVFRS